MNLNKSLILRTTKEYEYVLYRATQEECEEIEALCRIAQEEPNEKYPFLKEVHLCGHISEVSEGMLKSYIPLYHTWNEQRENSSYSFEVYEYPCYANKGRNPLLFSSNVRIHEDRQSAFKCAMSCLNTQYFFILKKDMEKIPLSEGIMSQITGIEPVLLPTAEGLRETVETFYKNQDERTTDNNSDSEIRSEDQGE